MHLFCKKKQCRDNKTKSLNISLRWFRTVLAQGFLPGTTCACHISWLTFISTSHVHSSFLLLHCSRSPGRQLDTTKRFSWKWNNCLAVLNSLYVLNKICSLTLVNIHIVNINWQEKAVNKQQKTRKSQSGNAWISVKQGTYHTIDITKIAKKNTDTSIIETTSRIFSKTVY